MFGSIGGAEVLFLLVLALLLFGPRRLPQIGRTIGKTLSEVRRATHDFRSSLEREVDLAEVDRARKDLTETARELTDPVVARGSLDPTPAASPDRTTDDAPPAPPVRDAPEPREF